MSSRFKFVFFKRIFDICCVVPTGEVDSIIIRSFFFNKLITELKAFIKKLMSGDGSDPLLFFIGVGTANIYISASRSDAGLAGSTAEAMACGLICVVSDIYDNNKWIIKSIYYAHKCIINNSRKCFKRCIN